MDVKLVIFDLDNTIWDFESNSRAALLELFDEMDREHRFTNNFDAFHREYVQINYRYWSDYEKGKIDKHTLRYGRFHEAFAAFGFSEPDAINRMADRYIEISPLKTLVFDGAHETLAYLQNKYQLAVITNGFNEVVSLKMANCRLEPYFGHVQTSEDAGFQKPHPAIFQLVLQKFGVDPQQALMIGDNLDTDIAGAKATGIHALLFDPWERHLSYPDPKITNLNQLKQIL